MNNNEIGGFIDFSLINNRYCDYHPKAIKLNSGRNSLKYFLLLNKHRSIYLPYYICDSVIDTLERLNVSYRFYSINELFEPIIDRQIKENDIFYYVNYFGININVVNDLVEKFQGRIIIDNTQAFFYKPVKEEATFYSPRKFFGVPDGGYLYTNHYLEESLEMDYSYNNLLHLFKRFETSAKDSYSLYLENEKVIDQKEMKRMSKITENLLMNINYSNAKSIRERNFLYLHSHLGDLNILNMNIGKLEGPIVYPFLPHVKGLKQYLISNDIYIPTYWKEVKLRVDNESFENLLVDNLIPLPIDHRYSISDLNKVINLVQAYKQFTI